MIPYMFYQISGITHVKLDNGEEADLSVLLKTEVGGTFVQNVFRYNEGLGQILNVARTGDERRF